MIFNKNFDIIISASYCLFEVFLKGNHKFKLRTVKYIINHY